MYWYKLDTWRFPILNRQSLHSTFNGGRNWHSLDRELSSENTYSLYFYIIFICKWISFSSLCKIVRSSVILLLPELLFNYLWFVCLLVIDKPRWTILSLICLTFIYNYITTISLQFNELIITSINKIEWYICANDIKWYWQMIKICFRE